MVFSSPSSATPTITDCVHDDAVLPLLQSPRFKAVVPQPNGLCWGAHIYERRARPAPSSFTSEFAFQATRSSSATSLAVDGVTLAGHGEAWHISLRLAAPPPPPPWACEHLFQKVLTPSDVGNLNRLVVPKHHAEKHFLAKRSNPLMAAGMGVHLDFMDGAPEGKERKKTWRFRYSYCTSSRIYIFTKGWRRYVREKGLQAGDTVAFSRSGFGPFKQMSIDYHRKLKTEKKEDDDDAAADVIAAVGDSRVVMLFGVDIAR
ncbi:hypothetical protein HU200_055375 [Digitaria exilis]|uniref:TF-B3 domain-containing protein n=1 Tax=Digitaria exilis TaxID=1010633 RepID=A0A835AJ21_9POAL|nr:hypothetical protein HU200_055375 [Digitaria exilis]